MRPYGTGIFNSMTIGRDILVVAGAYAYVMGGRAPILEGCSDVPRAEC
jgi:hypothetical protein